MIATYTVSQLTREVRIILESSIPGPIAVEGELVDYTHHSSGHRYFTLKDDKSQLRCVMWRQHGTGLFFTPAPGMRVVATGSLSVYERSGQYQLVVERLQPAGEGELLLAFKRLKERLEREGLFDLSRKRPLPAFPRSIGIVTSPTGAAIRDIIQVIGRRFPSVRLILRPTQVQGEGSAEEIAQAIADLNAMATVDVLIVGRGGGAAEDLWAFNEEIVARAIAASTIPVVSAVGHETDVTIADFVADCRAPTPSAAAEMVVRDSQAILDGIRALRTRLMEGAQRRLRRESDRVMSLGMRYGLKRFPDLLRRHEQVIDDLEATLCREVNRLVERRQVGMTEIAIALKGLDPRAALARGFAICRRLPDGSLVRTSSQLGPGSRVSLQFSSGAALCGVEEVHVERQL